ncbi:hypothetical protein MMW20_09805 [Enterobacter hormaechei]|nr:hypothetical protein CXP33_04810 [Enterobacter cloacae complex sp. TREC1]POU34100.1 hypothetical protein C3372_15505 [Enterobacter cloacae complex sp. ECNIH8]RMC69237.1 hypothetical protein EBH45_15270 [Enterobacter hormaechei]RRR30557.1 hypothetical protein CVV73_06705 [Enterobacter hormaechei]WGZ59712.1 hypothetical protein MMW20_09805 [Enterobacter hormaechei]
MPGGAALTGPTGDGAMFARWRCAYRAYGGEMVRYLPGGAALTGPTGVRWCGVCPVALTLTGPTGTVGVDFVGRVSEAPPGVVHASSSN